MKKLTKIILLTISISSLIFSSCKKYENSSDLVGKWRFNAAYKQGLAVDDSDPDSTFGYLLVDQSITYSFNEDLTYTKEIFQDYYDYELVDKDYSPVDLSVYKGKKLTMTISGKFKASEEKLILEAEKIAFSTGQEFKYQDYYMQNPSIGKKKSARDYRKTDHALIINSLENGNDEVFIPVEE